VYHRACFNNDDKSRVPQPRRRNIRDYAPLPSFFAVEIIGLSRSLDVTSMGHSRLCSTASDEAKNKSRHDLIPSNKKETK